MANSVDPDQTAPLGAVCSGFELFASLLNSSVMLGYIIFAAGDFSRRQLQMHFFLGALRENHTHCFPAFEDRSRLITKCRP